MDYAEFDSEVHFFFVSLEKDCQDNLVQET